MSRPQESYLKATHTNCKILHALASETYTGKLEKTENESTANNRRVVYLVACNLCPLEYEVNKKHLHSARKCPHCRAPHIFTTTREVDPVKRVKLRTLFVAGCGYVVVDGGYEAAKARLRVHREVFYNAWEVNGAAFDVAQEITAPHMLVHWTNELRGPAENFAVGARSARTFAEPLAQELAGVEPQEPEEVEEPVQIQTETPTEGWFDDLNKAAAAYGLLPPLPNRVEGWIATEDSKALYEAKSQLPKALHGCTFEISSVAAYPNKAPDKQTWYYFYTPTIATTDGFFG